MMKVLEKNQTKVLETEKLLRSIIDSPLEFKGDETLQKALKSQSSIAKYENQELHITTCSLNTLKSISDSILDRGFLGFNELRVNAKTAIEAALYEEEVGKLNKQTTTGLKLKVAKLERQLHVMQRTNFFLTAMVTDLRSKTKLLSEHNGTQEERKELYRVHNKIIEAEMNYIQNNEV
jgi:hypothetical protein